MTKHSTKSRRPRQPRTPRSSRRPPQSRAGEILDLKQQLRDHLVEEIRAAVARTAHELVQDEILELVGEPWSRKADSPMRRNGHTETTIFLDGEPHRLRRARVRDQDQGEEVRLRSLEALRSRDALDEEVKARLIAGLSTRRYEDALTRLSDGLGLKKSAVSAAFQRGAQKDLDALNGRSLAQWTFCTVYLDGTVFAEHTVVIAMGIGTDGSKRILGLVEGATENAQVVRSLLENLTERGLALTSRALFVIDGSKALRKAIVDAFGDRAMIQRCQVHKLRNVLGHLPPTRHAEARRRIQAAWNLVSYEDAKRELRKVVSWLQGISETAGNSLAEALEETLTVHRLSVRGPLRKTLATTNPIESANDIVKSNARRVKRWNGASMVMRWAGTGLALAERQFRRVKGHAALPALIAALSNNTLTEAKQSA